MPDLQSYTGAARVQQGCQARHPLLHELRRGDGEVDSVKRSITAFDLHVEDAVFGAAYPRFGERFRIGCGPRGIFRDWLERES